MTSLLTQGINPTPANPALVIYKERPPLMQVDHKQLARELLTKKNFKCFSYVMGKESGWENKKNPHSSAEGVGQLLDSTYENLGMKRSKSEVAQTVAALAYIGRKYGNGGPCAAALHFKKHNWY
jgi:hypothetical protein